MLNKKLKNKTAFSLIELAIVILVIGIIIAGVTQSSRLIGAFRLSTAKTLTQSSPVAGIKGLVFWYETSLDSSFADSEEENNTVVTTWYDNNPQSAIKYNAYAGHKGSSNISAGNSAVGYNAASSGNSGNTSGPTYIRDGINSIPTLRFTNAATTYRYLAADYYARNINNTDLTMFVVFYYRSGNGFIIDRQCNDNAGTTRACSGSYNNSNPLFGFWVSSNNLYYQIRDDAGTGFGGNFYYDTGYDVAANRKYVMTIERKYGVNVKSYINGVVNSTIQSTDNIGVITMDPVKIGRHADNNTDTLDVDISEVIFFSGPIKAADRTAVEQYLGKKYGINI